MGGLVFVDDVDVDPHTPLLGVFTDWVRHLGGSKSVATVRGYVSDVHVLARILARQADRTAPDPDLTLTPPSGVSAGMWSDAVRWVSVLTLSDLHPERLSAAFAEFGAGTPARATGPQRRQDATRRRAAAAWTTLCEYATVRGFLAANPMRDPRIDRGARPSYNPVPFELGEADTLLRVLATPDEARTSRKPWPLRDLALVSFLLTTGVRASEVCAVTVADVRDLDLAPHVHVLGKGSKFRTIPLARSTTAVLLEYLADRTDRLGEPAGTDRLFVHPDGRAFTTRSLQHLVYRWYARAGITPRGRSCVHALRHTFATQLVNSSASIVEVMELLGHASLETTRRYLKSVGHGLRDAVEANPNTELVARHSNSQPTR